MKKEKNQKTLLLIIVILLWFSQYVYIPFQNSYLTMQNVSANMIGIIIGAYGIAQCLLRFPAGVAADSIGKNKYFILTGILFSGLASCIRILSPNAEGFLIANILSGIASSTWLSYMVHYTGYFSKNQQQKATSTIILVLNLGMFLGFVISTIFYDKLGMRFLCALSTIAGILGTILAFKIKEHENIELTTSVSFIKFLSICKNKRLIFFSILTLIQQGIQMSTTMSFTTEILKDLGASSSIVGLSSILYMACAVLSAGFASSNFFMNLGAKLWIPIVFSLVALYCILVPTIKSIPVIFLLQTIPGMSTGVLFSYLTSESMKEVPQYQKSTAMGFFQGVFAIGMSIFPMVVGKIAESFSLKNSYFVLAVTAILGTASSILYYKNCNIPAEL